MPEISPASPCPCGRLDARRKALLHADCCGPYIDGFDARPAPDAEALMRSRYCAFVREDAPYLLATWHANERPASLSFDAGAKWLGLAVKSQRRIDDDHAEVEFVARQRNASGRAIRIHERSRFVFEQGRWFYIDGDQLEN